MASALSVAKLSTQLKVSSFMPGDCTTPKQAGWVDMRDFYHFMAVVSADVLVGTGITGFEIDAADDNVGTNPITIRAHALGSAPYAVGAQVVLEAIAAEVEALGASKRFFSVKLTTNNAGDKVNVTYIQGKPRFAQSQLTATV